MIAEHPSASVVNTLSLRDKQQVPDGYYRSKLFITPFSGNPLVAAAGPLFSLLERLYASPTLPVIEKMRKNIEHELHAFHSRIASQMQNEEVPAIAHYLLSATIDELLGKAYLRCHGVPANFSAFTPSSHDNIGPEQRFFDIVCFLKESPNQYLDLLELAYYCLIAGFEGVQHGKPGGRQLLDNLLEDLFQLIQQYRVNQTYTLFNQPKTRLRVAKGNTKKSFLIVTFGAIGVFIIAYFMSYMVLEHKARTVQLGHAVIAKLDN